jgi:hypothetical protein
MARITRIVGSLGIVLVAYWAYALVAVPWIEPAAGRQRSEAPSEEELRALQAQARERWQRELEGLFPPGSWELDDPTIVEMDEVRLLLQGYTQQEDGKKVEIRPCTMIFTPHRPDVTEADRRRGAIILEVPDGAVLEFDQPFELTKVGRLEKGELQGRVTIRSEGKSPGPEDDLRVVTRDVDVNEERIFTKHDVDFRLGRNHGRGRQMWIHFLSDPDKKGTKQRGPNVDGIESIKILHLEQLSLHLDDQGLLPGGQGTAGDRAIQPAPEAATDLPIEVKCRGPFQFDAIEQVATFEDHVTVLRSHPEGPSDQLNCETLSVYFARPRNSVPTPAEAGADEPEPKSEAERFDRLEMRPRRIQASGTPVVVCAPSQGIEARGEQLEYDLETGQLELDVLDDTQEVFLKQGPNEIHARWLQYQLVEGRRLGRAAAKGPGWLRAESEEKADQQLYARWGKLLHLRPHEGQPVISLYGDAELEFGVLGRLTATEIHFYLLELPADDRSDRVQVRPDRLVALGRVVIDSPRVSGTVDQLGVWFEEAAGEENAEDDAGGTSVLQASGGTIARQASWAPGTGEAGRETSPGGPRPSGGAAPTDRGGRRDRVRGTGPLGAADAPGAAAVPPLETGEPPVGGEADHHFEITGRLMEAQVLLPAGAASSDLSQHGDSELSELVIEGDVELKETGPVDPPLGTPAPPAARAGEPPVVVRGELIHVLNASRPDREVTVRGDPPSVQGRGLTLSGLNPGSSIKLDSGTNELRIDEPGWTELPLDRDLDGQPLDEPGRLRVWWQKRMVFDGRRIRFEGQVVARGRHHRGGSELSTETLDVHLARFVRLTEADQDLDRVEVQRIVAYGGVRTENRSFTEQGQSSVDRFHGANLDVNLETGASKSMGPGWMTSVRCGSSDLLSTPRDKGSGAGPSARPSGDSSAGASADPSAGARADASATTPEADQNELRYLDVRFQGPLEGNVRSRQMTFRDEVRAAYAPVDCWEPALNPDDLESLGPDGVLLSCRELTVTHMPQPTGEGRAVELVATGNVVVEGRTFTARAPRMTYDDAKQLLILESGGWTDAELYHQKRVGAPWSEVQAGRILYWRSTGQIHVERARSLKTN